MLAGGVAMVSELVEISSRNGKASLKLWAVLDADFIIHFFEN